MIFPVGFWVKDANVSVSDDGALNVTTGDASTLFILVLALAYVSIGPPEIL